MRYKFEFEEPDFEKGDCDMCPLTYVDWEAIDWDEPRCVFHSNYKDFPLEEVKEDEGDIYSR